MSKPPSEVQKALKDAKAARALLEKAHQRVVAVYEAYVASIAESVFAELRTLEWKRPTGRGARTLVQSTAPVEGVLGSLSEVRREIERETNHDLSLGSEVGDLHVRLSWHYCYTRSDLISVTLDAKDAEKHGVYNPPKKSARDKRRMNQLLDEAKLTPAELQKLLNQAKNKGA